MDAVAAGDAEDFRSDGVEREDFVSETCVGDGSGHSPNGAGGLVLGEDCAALLADDATAAGAIGAIPVRTTARTPEP